MKELKVLIDEQQLQEKIKEISEEISKDFEGESIILICILKGSMFFTVDLARQIKNDVTIEVIKVSSYGNGTVGSEVKMQLDLKESIEGKNVIVIEDIIDTGRTLSYLLEHLKKKNPKSLKLCALLDKPERRIFDVKTDYTGFEIPDEFVVGYGLDWDEKYRQLPYIGYFES